MVLAARVCLKHMLFAKKPTVFVSVTDLVGVLRTQSGFGVSAEVTRKILSKCSAFTFLHSGAAQTLCDNCPEEVPEFSEYCASHRSDIVGFPEIVVQGDNIMLMPDPCRCREPGRGPNCCISSSASYFVCTWSIDR